jgi:NAD(P)H-flavin reductase
MSDYVMLRVLSQAKHMWCRGEDLQESGNFQHGHHLHVQVTGCRRERPLSRSRDTGHRRHLLEGRCHSGHLYGMPQ